MCMLWQRLGRAARDPSREASGIYVVEPQFMDYHRQRAKQRAAERTERAQRKRLQGVIQPENPSAQKKARTQDEMASLKINPRKRVQAQPVLPNIAPAMNKLIVIEQHHQNYEAAAMDTYINARSRGICRRRVSEEFFGNTPSTLSVRNLWGGESRIDPRSASPDLACSNGDCPHCVAAISRLCCDTCNPGSFILPVPVSTAPRQTVLLTGSRWTRASAK
jgi:hypothetical protein